MKTLHIHKDQDINTIYNKQFAQDAHIILPTTLSRMWFLEQIIAWVQKELALLIDTAKGSGL